MRRLRDGSHPKKSVEEAAFPGLSLKKKVFSVSDGVRKPRASPPNKDTGLKRTSEISKPARKPGLDADEQLVPEKGDGKQKTKYQHPQRADPASSTMSKDDLPDASRATALRMKSASAKSVDIPPSSNQSAASGMSDTGLRAVAVNVGSVREFEELVRRHNSSVIAANSAAVPEELIGELENLGIKADLPQWKKGEKQ